MKYIVLLILSFTLNFTFAQNAYDALTKPNTYRNADNPNYWQNKIPFEGYWQQDVHYTIKANVDETKHIVDAQLELTYWNNSPDDLPFVYFHLYQNAFQPDSYYEKLWEGNGLKANYGYYEKQKKGTEVPFVKVDGKEQKITLDNTILRVDLDTPIKAGGSVTFTLDFKTYFDRGSMRRRMGIFRAENGDIHYNGVHWYPRISVYDRKFGWTTDQHMDKEFYGDFGTWDVELTFSENYVVDATGSMINRDEALPKELREKLDIKNFTKPVPRDSISVITPYDPEKRKTWKFHAENVHDFAFTADPTYRIGEVVWNGKKCIALAREHNAYRWQNAAQYTADIIKTYSEDIGMYTYHKMIVADAEDGMEYPMLTLDSGGDPGYRGLLCHEIGHNWFFGQVGNNETYRASLDEGFTQFLTAWSLIAIDGDTLVSSIPNSKSKYYNKFKKPQLALESRVYGGYYYNAFEADLPPLNTHSSDFNSSVRQGGGYGQVYNKTATMLYNLQYVLGDELFLKAMQNYFAEFKIAHPYWIDFRNSVIHFTKVDLNWFFDQGVETQKVIDYAVNSVKKSESGYAIEFERIGEMQMPIEFTITYDDGSTEDYYIPNTWFNKKSDATVLAKWYGWGKIQSKYTAAISTSKKIDKVEIDPSKRMADINMLNNSNKLPIDWSFDHKISNRSDRKTYEAFHRPAVWYNAYDGMKLGYHVNGHYLGKYHKTELTVWANTRIAQDLSSDLNNLADNNPFSFQFKYSNPFKAIHKRSRFNLDLRYLDGLQFGKVGISFKDRQRDNALNVYFKSLYRANTSDLNYLINPTTWATDSWNNSINLEYTHSYDYARGYGNIDVNLRSTSIFSDAEYAYLQLSSTTKTYFRKLRWKNRFFAQLGTGSNYSVESSLGLAGANAEQMMDNKYTRSAGILPTSLGGYGNTIGNFQQGGGLNLRGYAGYLAPADSGNFTHFGNSGISINSELEFGNMLPSFPAKLKKTIAIDTYLFGDAGFINTNRDGESLAFNDLRADAGIGATFTIKKFAVLQKVKPLVIRFDMPLFINATPFIDGTDSYFSTNRWIIGINRAF